MTPVPAPNVDQIVILSTYGTITIPANQVFQITTSGAYPAGPFYYNILNTGPGVVYIAAPTTGAVGPDNAETLPVDMADNGIFVPEGYSGLLVFTGISGATLSIRVVQQTMATSF